MKRLQKVGRSETLFFAIEEDNVGRRIEGFREFSVGGNGSNFQAAIDCAEALPHQGLMI